MVEGSGSLHAPVHTRRREESLQKVKLSPSTVCIPESHQAPWQLSSLVVLPPTSDFLMPWGYFRGLAMVCNTVNKLIKLDIFKWWVSWYVKLYHNLIFLLIKNVWLWRNLFRWDRQKRKGKKERERERGQLFWEASLILKTKGPKGASQPRKVQGSWREPVLGRADLLFLTCLQQEGRGGEVKAEEESRSPKTLGGAGEGEMYSQWRLSGKEWLLPSAIFEWPLAAPSVQVIATKGKARDSRELFLAAQLSHFEQNCNQRLQITR